ncbi:Aste57867_17448 [Aphanomyces stellatus]|uniref:Aste57867_17448 protein n=1 Tax=Aphanomyces stellatus TaxID=120398 RepID=A0A485L7T4_9STRA|nr:hypothetical protein As57867_017388 [Aphanomyces stellatus]VFT94202.1 Aste57867_17448 [Aphanomyces stellatus]
MASTPNLSQYPAHQALLQQQQEDQGQSINVNGIELVDHAQTPPPPPQTSGTIPSDTLASDEALARQLDHELNAPRRRPRVVVAQPVLQPVPFNCGSCGTMHHVQRAAPGARFPCTVCGAFNLLPNTMSPRVVIVDDYPPPLFCTLL